MANDKRGLTVLELLAAMALGAMVIVAGYRGLSVTRRAWEAAQGRMERASVARAVLDMMARDLSGAVADEERGLRLLGADESSLGIKDGSGDELFFVGLITADLAREEMATDIYRFGYWLKPDDSGNVLERAYEGPESTGDEYGFAGISSQPLAGGVTDIRFRYIYWDNGWRETVSGDWDSLGDGFPEDAELDRLPAAVKVWLTVGDAAKQETFSVTIPLRMAEKN